MKKLLPILLLLLTACQQKEKRDLRLDQLSWLEGEWQMDMNEATFYESWQRLSDTSMGGVGLLVASNGDTLFGEELYLIQKGNTLFYEPAVSNQNDGTSISFIETALTDSSMRFENPTHDFPQIIHYTCTDEQSIHAYVSGMQNGKERQDDFYFKKKVK